MSVLLSDLRFGLRQLARHPGFALLAVLTLALGIGAGTAVFSVANAALLRPLPGISDPRDLVTFYRIQKNESYDNLSYPDFLDYAARNHTLAGLAAHCGSPMSLQLGTADRIIGDVVTGSYFQVLGAQPEVGRLIIPQDDGAGAPPVAVLSWSLWQRKFGGDRNVPGRAVMLNGHPFTIVGVASREFTGTLTGEPFDLWTPLATVGDSIPRLSQGILHARNAGWLDIFGRLKPGVAFSHVEADIKTIAGQLSAEYPLTNSSRSVSLVRGIGLYPDDRAEVGSLLGLLAGAVGLLLVIACANVAGLFLVRAWGRRREIAVRLAIGAGRARILRQLVTEGVLLAVAAGGTGIIMSEWAARLMAAIRPGSVLHQLDVSLDGRVLAFALAASLVTGAVLALAPAARSLSPDLAASLKNGAAGAGLRRSRAQRVLVISQVAVSFLLLSGAGLLLRDLNRILTASPGYETRNLAMGSVDLIIQGYSQPRGEALYRQLLDRLPHIPGVVSATLASTVPPEEWPGRVSVFHPGEEPPPELMRAREMELGLRVDVNTVAPEYFRTLGISLIQGRDFTIRDDGNAPPVVIVNQSLARRMWPGKDAIGQRISIPGAQGQPRAPMEVIGVAADTRSRALTTDAVLFLYLPLLQNYGGRSNLIVRTTSNPRGAIAGIAQTLESADRDLALYNPQTMDEHVARSLWRQRMAAAWIGAFSILALLLAAIGLYGVMAQSIAQRTREVGIRMAIGAAPGAVARLVLRDGMTLAACGLAIGIPAAIQLNGRLGSWIPGISGGDAWSFAGTALLLLIVMAAACWAPARRAARVDPVEALRTE